MTVLSCLHRIKRRRFMPADSLLRVLFFLFSFHRRNEIGGTIHIRQSSSVSRITSDCSENFFSLVYLGTGYYYSAHPKLSGTAYGSAFLTRVAYVKSVRSLRPEADPERRLNVMISEPDSKF